MFRIVSYIALVYASAVALIACSNPSGEFFYGALGLGDKKLLVATSNPGALTIVMYDLEGNLVDVVADYTFTNDIPRGIAPFDGFNIAVLLDGVDRFSLLSLRTGASSDFPDPNMTGALFQMVHDPISQRYYAIEGNTIEAFDSGGGRIGNGATPFINVPLGACTGAPAHRGLAATGDGRLIAVANGLDDLYVYNVSGSTATCVSTNTTLGGTVDPFAAIVHSNGLVYVAAQGDDRVYSFPNDVVGAGTVVWATNLPIINNPTALLELPDGTILVASDGTNSIERIDTAGARVGTNSFIRDAFTGAVTQMMLIGGE